MKNITNKMLVTYMCSKNLDADDFEAAQNAYITLRTKYGYTKPSSLNKKRALDVLQALHQMYLDTELVTRTNLMTGEKYQEPKNTPAYCSPSCESYWSM